MNRLKTYIAVVAASALLLTGCNSSAGTIEPGRGTADSLTVVASFSTMADFVSKVGGKSVSVSPLVPAGAEAHDWEPTAQDIAKLEAADMLVISGAGFEHWVDGVIPTLGNKELRVVEASAGIELLEGADHGDHHHEMDPHVWLDPMNAKRQLENIRDGLIACDTNPDNHPLYEANYDKWAAELDALDKEYRDTLEPLPGKNIVVAHEAFGYLCHAYGLHQVAAQGLSPEGEPDPGQMAEVIEYAREHTVKVIFFEQAASPKVAEAIAREVGAETAVLSPLEGMTQAQLEAGADYFSVMRENLAALEAALS